MTLLILQFLTLWLCPLTSLSCYCYSCLQFSTELESSNQKRTNIYFLRLGMPKRSSYINTLSWLPSQLTSREICVWLSDIGADASLTLFNFPLLIIIPPLLRVHPWPPRVVQQPHLWPGTWVVTEYETLVMNLTFLAFCEHSNEPLGAKSFLRS
jgi:hypothetical protein